MGEVSTSSCQASSSSPRRRRCGHLPEALARAAAPPRFLPALPPPPLATPAGACADRSGASDRDPCASPAGPERSTVARHGAALQRRTFCCRSRHVWLMSWLLPSAATSWLMHSTLREASATTARRCAYAVRLSSPTNCDSCECVRLQKTTCATAATHETATCHGAGTSRGHVARCLLAHEPASCSALAHVRRPGPRGAPGPGPRRHRRCFCCPRAGRGAARRPPCSAAAAAAPPAGRPTAAPRQACAAVRALRRHPSWLPCAHGADRGVQVSAQRERKARADLSSRRPHFLDQSMTPRLLEACCRCEEGPCCWRLRQRALRCSSDKLCPPPGAAAPREPPAPCCWCCCSRAARCCMADCCIHSGSSLAAAAARAASCSACCCAATASRCCSSHCARH